VLEAFCGLFLLRRSHSEKLPLNLPRFSAGFPNTPVDVERQKPLIYQWLLSVLWTLVDIGESKNGSTTGLVSNRKYLINESFER